jgi:hypothetical protein
MPRRSLQAPISQRFVRNDTGGSYDVHHEIREDKPGKQKLLNVTKNIGFSSQQQAIEFGDTEGILLQREAERIHRVPANYRFIVTVSTWPSFR